MRNTKKCFFVFLLLSLIGMLSVFGAMTASAATYSNLTVSKDGTNFKVTKGKKSLSFRFDWDEEKDTYTGYDRVKISKLVAPGVLVPGMGHEGSSNKVQYIMAAKLIRVNGKLYTGMPLKAFHKKVKRAWGTGYYTYQDNKTKEWVKLGAAKPTKKDFRKARTGTLNWVGMRGKLKMYANLSINARKNDAAVSIFAIYGSEADTE